MRDLPTVTAPGFGLFLHQVQLLLPVHRAACGASVSCAPPFLARGRGAVGSSHSGGGARLLPVDPGRDQAGLSARTGVMLPVRGRGQPAHRRQIGQQPRAGVQHHTRRASSATRSGPNSDTKITRRRRAVNGAIGLLVPKTVIRQRCALYISNAKPAQRGALLHDDDFTIVAKYGSEYRGLVQYYLLAQDVFRLGRLRWTMETSMLKTAGRKTPQHGHEDGSTLQDDDRVTHRAAHGFSGHR